MRARLAAKQGARTANVGAPGAAATYASGGYDDATSACATSTPVPAWHAIEAPPTLAATVPLGGLATASTSTYPAAGSVPVGMGAIDGSMPSFPSMPPVPVAPHPLNAALPSPAVPHAPAQPYPTVAPPPPTVAPPPPTVAPPPPTVAPLLIDTPPLIPTPLIASQHPAAAQLPSSATVHAAASPHPPSVPLPLPPSESAELSTDAHGGWPTMHQSVAVWPHLAHSAGMKPPPAPEAQPAPPGLYDLPADVLALSAREDTAAAAAAAAPYRADIVNTQLVRALWTRRRMLDATAFTPEAPPEPWASYVVHARARLFIWCSASVGSIHEHPLLLEHASAVESVAALPEEACAERGCDAYAELWAAMESGSPLLVFETPFPTRRARKQLLYRLSKQAAAARYTWEAITRPGTEGTDNAVLPTLEEGWACVH